MDELILARHGESLYSAAGLLNGDPSLPCPLTPAGIEQARNLGGLLSGAAIELWCVTAFERTVQTAAIARQAAAAARGAEGAAVLEIGELNDPRYGRYEGAALEVYRAWSQNASSDEPAPGGGESRVQVVGRYVRGYELLLGRPERVVAAVAHSLPVAYLIGAADGIRPRPRTAMVSYAIPHHLDRDRVEAAVGLLRDWLTAPDW
jgi:broad specificity phosphatase PhoE